MTLFGVLTVLFIIVSVAMILIILVQRPQGGGLAGAFGGAGGGGTETVFGGRVGDALTWFTCIAFGVYLFLAIGLNMADAPPQAPPPVEEAAAAGEELPAEEDGIFLPDEAARPPTPTGDPDVSLPPNIGIDEPARDAPADVPASPQGAGGTEAEGDLPGSSR